MYYRHLQHTSTFLHDSQSHWVTVLYAILNWKTRITIPMVGPSDWMIERATGKQCVWCIQCRNKVYHLYLITMKIALLTARLDNSNEPAWYTHQTIGGYVVYDMVKFSYCKYWLVITIQNSYLCCAITHVYLYMDELLVDILALWKI